jgi:hypothetical protein
MKNIGNLAVSVIGEKLTRFTYNNAIAFYNKGPVRIK